MRVRVPISTRCVFIPTYEKTSVFFEASGTSSDQEPSIPELTPNVVPSTTTEAPITGSPAESFTTPPICWAAAVETRPTPSSRNRANFRVKFFIKLVLVNN